ncbi:MAG: FeoB-associated Cys-rich membrane protein [Proteobacteria bacterium]|nr:FeoB-associated Cys-rich membrane protein [Pseudomonadota bacterium]
MIETILIWIVISVSAFFTGRKFYRQWRTAFDKKSQVSCGQGCCSCGTSSSCSTKIE